MPERLQNICMFVLVLLALAAILAVSLIGGCAKERPVSSSIAGARAGVTHLGVRFDDISRAALLIQPRTDATGQAYAQVIVDHSAQGKAESVAIEKRLGEAEESAEKASETLTRLEGRWYVRAGRLIERIFWLLLGGWILSGVLAVVFGISGVPLLQAVGHWIVRFLPFANVFASVRDTVIAPRTLVPAGATDIKPRPRRR